MTQHIETQLNEHGLTASEAASQFYNDALNAIRIANELSNLPKKAKKAKIPTSRKQ